MTIQWPTSESLTPSLDKLKASPGSLILVAIDRDKFGFANVTFGWFSAEERKSLRGALQRAKAKRKDAALSAC